MNAVDLGSILADCACACDPIHLTAQGKSIWAWGAVGNAAFLLVEMGHVNISDDVPMLMTHVTL